MQDPIENDPGMNIEVMMENVEKRRAKVSKRNAAIISVVVHGLFIVMAFWVVAMTLPQKEEVEFVAAPPPRPRLEPRKLEMKVRVNQLTKRSSRPKLQPRMMVNAPSDMALPEIKKNPDAIKNKLQRNFSTMGVSGFGSGIGGGLGTGTGGGMGGMGLPPAIADRCSAANRSSRMRKSGGRVSSEKAVTDALAWLSVQQNADGSFGETFPVAMTGLTVLAFLGHCETPDSPLYGEVVGKAIGYLVSRSNMGKSELTASDGGGSGASYEHGIATYALGEAYIMTGNPDYREPFLKGVERIIKGQNSDGGWVYAMNGGASDSDTSVSGWQIQALKSAYLANLEEIAPEVELALDRAVENLKRVYSKERQTFGYKVADSKGDNLGGVGVFTMSMWKHRKSKEVKGATERIMARTEDTKYSDGGDMDYKKMNMYGMYYDVQAMFAVGGSDWNKFNKWFQKPLAEAQNKDGSWPGTGGGSGHSGGEVANESAKDFEIYRTAMCTMMLEVYYRYLPVVDM